MADLVTMLAREVRLYRIRVHQYDTLLLLVLPLLMEKGVAIFKDELLMNTLWLERHCLPRSHRCHSPWWHSWR